MNFYKLTVAGINVAEGIHRFNDNQAMYEKYLNKFVNDDNYSALCSAVAIGDVETAFRAAHTLKGIAGNLSLTNLYNDVYPIVEKLRGGSLENVPQLLEKVTSDYETIVAALDL